MYPGSVRGTRKCIINAWFGRTFRFVAVRNRRCVWPVMSGWRHDVSGSPVDREEKKRLCAFLGWVGHGLLWSPGALRGKKNGSVLFRRATSSASLNHVISMCTLSGWLYSRAAGTPGPLKGFQGGPRQTRNTFDCDLVHWRTWSIIFAIAYPRPAVDERTLELNGWDKIMSLSHMDVRSSVHQYLITSNYNMGYYPVFVNMGLT